MKVRIYEEEKKKVKKEKEVFLKLVKHCDGTVRLMALNKDGGELPSPILLDINKDGICLWECYGNDNGFAREHDRIKIRDY